VLLFLAAAAACGDEVELLNGTKLPGTVRRQTLLTVTIAGASRPGEAATLSTSEVRSISIDGKRRTLRHGPAQKRSLTTRAPARRKRQRTFTGLTSAEYQKKFNELVPKGYRPAAIRGYASAGQARYDLTLEKRSGGRWLARHNCPRERFLEENARAESAGMSLVVHSQFRVATKVIHAAVWEMMPVTFHESDEIPQTGRTSPSLAPIDDMVLSFLREHDLPGAGVAIARRGKVLYARGFGYADMDTHEPVQPDSLFRIASLSKPVTAVAVLQLVQAGKLALDTRVVDVLRVRAPRGKRRDPRLRAVTIRHLLQHTAGWDRSKSFDPMFRSARIAKELRVPAPAGPQHVIRYMFGRRLDFDPGERKAYSNFGYCVLGRVIEKLTGRSYEDHVQRSVLAPLGVTRMRIGATRLQGRAEGEVCYHTRYAETGPSVFESDLGKRVPVQYGSWCLEAMDAHGGWIASAVDLVRFASSLDDDAQTRVLSRESVRTMFAPPAEPVSRDAQGKLEPAYYACGWQVRPKTAGNENTWHNGSLAGTSTLLVRRHDGFCWAVLFNTGKTISGSAPSGLIDGAMHRAVNKVCRWPRGRALPTED